MPQSLTKPQALELRAILDDWFRDRTEPEAVEYNALSERVDESDTKGVSTLLNGGVPYVLDRADAGDRKAIQGFQRIEGAVQHYVKSKGGVIETTVPRMPEEGYTRDSTQKEAARLRRIYEARSAYYKAHPEEATEVSARALENIEKAATEAEGLKTHAGFGQFAASVAAKGIEQSPFGFVGDLEDIPVVGKGLAESRQALSPGQEALTEIPAQMIGFATFGALMKPFNYILKGIGKSVPSLGRLGGKIVEMERSGAELAHRAEVGAAKAIEQLPTTLQARLGHVPTPAELNAAKIQIQLAKRVWLETAAAKRMASRGLQSLPAGGAFLGAEFATQGQVGMMQPGAVVGEALGHLGLDMDDAPEAAQPILRALGEIQVPGALAVPAAFHMGPGVAGRMGGPFRALMGQPGPPEVAPTGAPPGGPPQPSTPPGKRPYAPPRATPYTAPPGIPQGETPPTTKLPRAEYDVEFDKKGILKRVGLKVDDAKRVQLASGRLTSQQLHDIFSSTDEVMTIGAGGTVRLADIANPTIRAAMREDITRDRASGKNVAEGNQLEQLLKVYEDLFNEQLNKLKQAGSPKAPLVDPSNIEPGVIDYLQRVASRVNPDGTMPYEAQAANRQLMWIKFQLASTGGGAAAKAAASDPLIAQAQKQSNEIAEQLTFLRNRSKRLKSPARVKAVASEIQRLEGLLKAQQAPTVATTTPTTPSVPTTGVEPTPTTIGKPPAPPAGAPQAAPAAATILKTEEPVTSTTFTPQEVEKAAVEAQQEVESYVVDQPSGGSTVTRTSRVGITDTRRRELRALVQDLTDVETLKATPTSAEIQKEVPDEVTRAGLTAGGRLVRMLDEGKINDAELAELNIILNNAINELAESTTAVPTQPKELPKTVVPGREAPLPAEKADVRRELPIITGKDLLDFQFEVPIKSVVPGETVGAHAARKFPTGATAQERLDMLERQRSREKDPARRRAITLEMRKVTSGEPRGVPTRLIGKLESLKEPIRESMRKTVASYMPKGKLQDSLTVPDLVAILRNLRKSPLSKANRILSDRIESIINEASTRTIPAEVSRRAGAATPTLVSEDLTTAARRRVREGDTPRGLGRVFANRPHSELEAELRVLRTLQKTATMERHRRAWRNPSNNVSIVPSFNIEKGVYDLESILPALPGSDIHLRDGRVIKVPPTIDLNDIIKEGSLVIGSDVIRPQDIITTAPEGSPFGISHSRASIEKNALNETVDADQIFNMLKLLYEENVPSVKANDDSGSLRRGYIKSINEDGTSTMMVPQVTDKGVKLKPVSVKSDTVKHEGIWLEDMKDYMTRLLSSFTNEGLATLYSYMRPKTSTRGGRIEDDWTHWRTNIRRSFHPIIRGILNRRAKGEQPSTLDIPFTQSQKEVKDFFKMVDEATPMWERLEAEFSKLRNAMAAFPRAALEAGELPTGHIVTKELRGLITRWIEAERQASANIGGQNIPERTKAGTAVLDDAADLFARLNHKDIQELLNSRTLGKVAGDVGMDLTGKDQAGAYNAVAVLEPLLRNVQRWKLEGEDTAKWADFVGSKPSPVSDKTVQMPSGVEGFADTSSMERGITDKLGEEAVQHERQEEVGPVEDEPIEARGRVKLDEALEGAVVAEGEEAAPTSEASLRAKDYKAEQARAAAEKTHISESLFRASIDRALEALREGKLDPSHRPAVLKGLGYIAAYYTKIQKVGARAGAWNIYEPRAASIYTTLNKALKEAGVDTRSEVLVSANVNAAIEPLLRRGLSERARTAIEEGKIAEPEAIGKADQPVTVLDIYKSESISPDILADQVERLAAQIPESKLAQAALNIVRRSKSIHPTAAKYLQRKEAEVQARYTKEGLKLGSAGPSARIMERISKRPSTKQLYGIVTELVKEVERSGKQPDLIDIREHYKDTTKAEVDKRTLSPYTLRRDMERSLGKFLNSISSKLKAMKTSERSKELDATRSRVNNILTEMGKTIKERHNALMELGGSYYEVYKSYGKPGIGRRGRVPSKLRVARTPTKITRISKVAEEPLDLRMLAIESRYRDRMAGLILDSMQAGVRPSSRMYSFIEQYGVDAVAARAKLAREAQVKSELESVKDSPAEVRAEIQERAHEVTIPKSTKGKLVHPDIVEITPRVITKDGGVLRLSGDKKVIVVKLVGNDQLIEMPIDKLEGSTPEQRAAISEHIEAVWVHPDNILDVANKKSKIPWLTELEGTRLYKEAVELKNNPQYAQEEDVD